mgnify:CR=1 FL=1
MSSDDSVSATLTTSGHKGKRILLINGSPAYQYANDSRTNTADGVGVVGAWSGFKDDGSAQVNSLAGGGNPSSTACKGFTLGINYSNRPYFEYKTTSGETKIFTASKELRDKNIISLEKAIDMLTFRPNHIFGLDKGTLGIGKPADITLFDEKKEYSIDPSKFKSRSKNSPYKDWKVRGKILQTIVNGQTVFKSN